MATCSIVRHAGGLPTARREFCEDLAATGVRYAEAVFSPGNHARRFGDDWYGPIEAVLDGLAAGARDAGVDGAAVPRHRARHRPGRGRAHARCRAPYAGAGVVALNAAGSERTGSNRSPTHLPARARRRAADRPPRRRVGGPGQRLGDARALRARTGSGTASARSRIRRSSRRSRGPGIPLEICPLSNVATGVYPSLEDAPLPGAPRRGRRRDAQHRRPADVRRLADRRSTRRRRRPGASTTRTSPTSREPPCGRASPTTPTKRELDPCDRRLARCGRRRSRRYPDALPRTGKRPADRPTHRRRSPRAARRPRCATATATVAVVGLGYVGLPLLVAAAPRGLPRARVGRRRRQGRGPPRRSVLDRRRRRTRSSRRSSRRRSPTDPSIARRRRRRSCSACRRRSPTARPTCRWCVRRPRTSPRTCGPGMLVVLESTTYPGTTEEFLRPILESSGLVAGQRLRARLLARAHRSRAAPAASSQHTPKVVSGLTERCRDLAVSLLLRRSCTSVAVTPTPREAEMAKLIENTYRQVNIALVNELAVMARDLGVDIWEALHAAATKPFGYQAFWPGPGVGGHCIAIDPTYLSWRAGQQLGYRIGFIEHANEVNNRMPDYVATARGRGAERRRQARERLDGARRRGRVQARRRRPARAHRPSRCSNASPRVAPRSPTTTRSSPELRARRRATCVSMPLDPASLGAADVVVILDRRTRRWTSQARRAAPPGWSSTRGASPSGSTSPTSSGSSRISPMGSARRSAPSPSRS